MDVGELAVPDTVQHSQGPQRATVEVEAGAGAGARRQADGTSPSAPRPSRSNDSPRRLIPWMGIRPSHVHQHTLCGFEVAERNPSLSRSIIDSLGLT